MNIAIPDKLMQVHAALAQHGISHAFGGAIALAFYGEPRATQDIDVNIALAPAEHRRVLDALATLLPIADIAFHRSVAERTREIDYVGVCLPIVSAEDLVVLKAAFNQPKDWLDIENLFDIHGPSLDASYLRRWLAEFYQPPDDVPLQRVEGLIGR